MSWLPPQSCSVRNDESLITFAALCSRHSNPLLEQFKVETVHLEESLVDLAVDLHDRLVVRRRHIHFLAFAHHQATDEFHLAPAPLEMIVNGGAAGPVAYLTEHRPHGRCEHVVARACKLVRAQAEDRLHPVAK